MDFFGFVILKNYWAYVSEHHCHFLDPNGHKTTNSNHFSLVKNYERWEGVKINKISIHKNYHFLSIKNSYKNLRTDFKFVPPLLTPISPLN